MPAWPADKECPCVILILLGTLCSGFHDVKVEKNVK